MEGAMPIKTVDSKTLKRWIKNNEAVVVDVREHAEHAAGKIKGSVLLPVDQLTKSALPACKGKKLVLHCRKGGRSLTACKKLIAENSKLNVYNLEGGIEAWQAEGLPVTSSGGSCMSIERQEHLVLGIFLVIVSTFGYHLSRYWFLVTGLMGSGLIFAGVTGSCYLWKLLSKMPWNCSSECHSSCSMKKKK